MSGGGLASSSARRMLQAAGAVARAHATVAPTTPPPTTTTSKQSSSVCGPGDLPAEPCASVCCRRAPSSPWPRLCRQHNRPAVAAAAADPLKAETLLTLHPRSNMRLGQSRVQRLALVGLLAARAGEVAITSTAAALPSGRLMPAMPAAVRPPRPTAHGWLLAAGCWPCNTHVPPFLDGSLLPSWCVIVSVACTSTCTTAVRARRAPSVGVPY
jgi:hypothetical protein